MYDTAKRVVLVKQRVRENTRRRQRCEAISLSAACMLLCAALTQAVDVFAVQGQTAAWGGAARCCCGMMRAAMCW